MTEEQRIGGLANYGSSLIYPGCMVHENGSMVLWAVMSVSQDKATIISPMSIISPMEDEQTRPIDNLVLYAKCSKHYPHDCTCTAESRMLVVCARTECIRWPPGCKIAR